MSTALHHRIALFVIAFIGIFAAYHFVEALTWTSPPASVEMHGYAWSENIGWISFNCDTRGDTGSDICGTSDYKVTIDNDGSLDGYAWSDNIGWIKFGGLSGFPEGPNGNAFIEYDSGDPPPVYIYGWARACAVFQSGCSGALKSSEELGGWDGWISFNCEDLASGCSVNYGSELTKGASSGSVFSPSYAWGGDVIGWILMSGMTFDFPFPPGAYACEHEPQEKSLSQDMWGTQSETVCAGDRVCSEDTFTCVDPIPPVLESFSANPPLVRAGESTTITWEVSVADDCTVTGPAGIVVGNGISGSGNSGPITNRSLFQISCIPTTGGLAVPVGTLTVQTTGTRTEI